MQQEIKALIEYIQEHHALHRDVLTEYLTGKGINLANVDEYWPDNEDSEVEVEEIPAPQAEIPEQLECCMCGKPAVTETDPGNGDPSVPFCAEHKMTPDKAA